MRGTKIFITLWMLVYAYACDAQISDDERIIRNLNKLIDPNMPGATNLSLLETCKRVEGYFVFMGYLKSQTKSGYQTMHHDYIILNSGVQLNTLYKNCTNAETLLYPSVLAGMFDVYLSDSESGEILGRMKKGYDIKIDEGAHF
ncbi:MAG: hypothetical protein ABJQ86_00890, partial [Cyclobacteriaceae bacterium]